MRATLAMTLLQLIAADPLLCKILYMHHKTFNDLLSKARDSVASYTNKDLAYV